MKLIFRNRFIRALLTGAMIVSSLHAAPFTAGNLAVAQAAASANNTTASVVEVSPTSTTPATPVQTIPIDGATAPNAIRVSGSATSTLYLTNSADGSLLVFTGHNSTTTGVNANTLLPRGVVTFNAAGTFSLAATYTGASGNQARSATTLNNTTWFIADQGGVYSNGNTTASPAGNFRGVKAFGGIVYIAQASSTTTLIQVSTLSAPTGGTVTGLPGLTNNASLQDFFLVQSGDNGTAFDVLYTLSATSNTAGTIAKYSLVSGAWVANGTHTTAFGGFGLAAADNGSGALLYVSTGQGALTANSLLKLADTAGYNAPIAITTANNVTLYTAPAGAIIKGVAFAPVSSSAAPALITVEPAASQTIGIGETATLSVVATGSPSPTYQWYLGNSGDTSSPISGATAASFTTPALSTTTSYWVRVTNSGGTDDSITSTITVTLSNNASLSALALSSGSLSPAFASGTLSYSVTVPNGTASLNLTPTFGNANATAQVRINGGAYSNVSSGAASASLPLNVGPNTVELLVTAQDGTTTATYTLTVTRSAPSVLVAGDLLFTAINADEDGWAMVALRSIPANTTVYFTDNEWDGVSSFNTGEAYFQWVSGASVIPAGTVIRFLAIDNATNRSASIGTLTLVSGGAGFSSTEESLYAYVADTVNGTPTFLSAICTTSFGTASAGYITNTGLTLGNGAIQTGNTAGSDFAEFTAPRNTQFSFAAYKTIVSDIANWTDSGDGTYAATVPNTTAFTLAGPSSINLSSYVRVGRYDLPEPTRSTAPSGNLLCQEASGIAYNWDTDTLFIVGDGSTSVTEVTKTGVFVSTMTLPAGGSPQGTEFYDTEGITYIGGGQFVFTEERDRQLVKFTYSAGGTFSRPAAQTVKLGTTVGNIGLEGLSYDPQSSGFIVVKEMDPIGIFQTTIDFSAGTASNGSPATVNSTNLFAPALASLEDMSDVFALSNIPSLAGQPQGDSLLILSQESGLVRHVDRNGNILGTLTLYSDAGNPLSIQNQTHEGITMDRLGNIYIVSENGGGDIDHPQLWVYAPSATANQAPTALALSTSSTTIPENTSTASAVKLATLVVTDADGVGSNSLAVSGTDSAFFEIIGSGLYLKAGTALSFAAKSTYNVTVTVDDTSVGATPDASASFTLNLTAVGGGASFLRVTEVAPWSSGNSAVAADWFELTNTGTTAIDITGFKMFDSGAGGFGSSGPLNGITTIAPGESVIFVDGQARIATFLSHWFGANPPSGLQVGYYGGPGLSTGGDAVKIYDSVGNLLASVSFGASSAVPGPYLTFDNSAGQNNATLTQLSALGTNSAFTAAATTNEVGSPGIATLVSTPLVSIVATDASASEAGSNSGTFRISRTGTTTLAMDVVISIATGAGQATAADYTPSLTSPVTIPAGQSYVDITLTPVNDGLEEPAETITVTLGDTGTYDVGSPASATITIAASFTPVQDWRQAFFGTTANSGLTADTADFDGDGVANLLEYALGGNPADASAAEGTALLPVGTVGDTSDPLLTDRFSLAFVLDNPNPAELTYTVEATADLITWTPVASKTGAGAWTWLGGGTSRIVTSGTSVVTVKIGDLVPTAGNDRRMMRLKVTTP